MFESRSMHLLVPIATGRNAEDVEIARTRLEVGGAHLACIDEVERQDACDGKGLWLGERRVQ